jgi:hypothetical protein
MRSAIYHTVILDIWPCTLQYCTPAFIQHTTARRILYFTVYIYIQYSRSEASHVTTTHYNTIKLSNNQKQYSSKSCVVHRTPPPPPSLFFCFHPTPHWHVCAFIFYYLGMESRLRFGLRGTKKSPGAAKCKTPWLSGACCNSNLSPRFSYTVARVRSFVFALGQMASYPYPYLTRYNAKRKPGQIRGHESRARRSLLTIGAMPTTGKW